MTKPSAARSRVSATCPTEWPGPARPGPARRGAARAGGCVVPRLCCAGLEQRPQHRPHVVQDHRVRRFNRVNAVGLEHQLRARRIGHALEQKGHQRRAFGLSHAGKQPRKFIAVFAPVVRRHLHAGQQHRGPSGLGGTRHLQQVGAGHVHRQAAQGIVATEFQDHMGGLVLEQQARQPRAAARRGVAADAGIDHRGSELLLHQALLQQGHPAAAAPEPVLGRQAVSHHQHDTPPRGPLRQGTACPTCKHRERGTVRQPLAPGNGRSRAQIQTQRRLIHV